MEQGRTKIPRLLSISLLLVPLVAAAPSPSRGDSDAVFIQAAYERAWLTETGWSITIWADGRVEERRVRNRCGRRGCGEDRVSIRSRGRLSDRQLEELRQAAEDGGFFDLQPEYRSGMEDAVAARVSVSLGERTHEVRVEDPWWKNTRVASGFARVWNLVVAYGRPSVRRDLAWTIP